VLCFGNIKTQASNLSAVSGLHRCNKTAVIQRSNHARNFFTASSSCSAHPKLAPSLARLHALFTKVYESARAQTAPRWGVATLGGSLPVSETYCTNSGAACFAWYADALSPFAPPVRTCSTFQNFKFLRVQSHFPVRMSRRHLVLRHWLAEFGSAVFFFFFFFFLLSFLKHFRQVKIISLGWFLIVWGLAHEPQSHWHGVRGRIAQHPHG